MKGRGYEGVVSVILTLSVTCAYTQNASSEESCTQLGTDSDDVTCYFSDNLCGWQNAEDDNFDWKIEDDRITAASSDAGAVARLESPWLCSTGTNYTSLQFSYYMGRDDSACLLSVLIRTPAGTAIVLTKENHRGSEFKSVGPVYIACAKNPYQIILESTKHKSGKCGYFRTEGISVDNIEVGVVREASSSIHHCPVTTTTRQDFGASTSPPKVLTSEGTPGREEGDGGLTGGAVAGIVVALVIPAIVVAVIVFVFWRRSKGKASATVSQKRPSPSGVESPAVPNRAYSPSDEPDEADAPNPRLSDNAAAKPKSYTGAEVYEIVSDPHPGDVYHIPDEVNNRSDVTSAARHGSTSHARDVGRGKGDDQDEYNALLFESVRVNIDCAGPGNVYDSTGGSDTYNALSRGSQETALPASTTSDYDHV